MFKWDINYKARLYGIKVVSADPYGSTRFCNKCGARTKHEASSNGRILRCPRCGLSVGRDANATMNLAVR